jgi:uncharacterized protein YecT (DUF1311 family)
MVSMIKRLLSLISRKSSTIQSNPRNNAANEVVRCGNAALAKLDLENWNSKVACFTVALVLLIPIMLSGADQKECMETATTQLKLNQCATSRLKAADDELNRIYQAILRKYKDDREFLEKLRNAQRAWLTFRDAELEAKFPFGDKQYHYGSGYPMCADLFLAQRTQERAKHLREWLDGTEEGDVCAGSVQYKPAR